MFFMGQEWSASSPFLYFTDHHDELGKGVTEGRRKEFSEFSEFKDSSKRALIPDPQAETTFTKSKLNWSELEQSPHRETLRLYSDFVRFRQADLKDRHRGHWQVEQVSGTAIAIRYHRKKGGDILMVAQLTANDSVLELESETLRPADGRAWKLVLSSNQPIYGGKAAAHLNHDGKKVTLTEPELVVFREQGEGIYA
jgi:maltooligosyltrehalose trehalohydrolase